MPVDFQVLARLLPAQLCTVDLFFGAVLPHVSRVSPAGHSVPDDAHESPLIRIAGVNHETVAVALMNEISDGVRACQELCVSGVI